MNDLLFFLITKHFIVDFILQTPAQVKYKGIFGNPVGFSHSLEQGIWTAAILCFYTNYQTAISIAYFEICLHYLIDYSKMRFGCRDTTDKKFWIQLGLDQYAHYLTYLGIIYLLEIVAFK